MKKLLIIKYFLIILVIYGCKQENKAKQEETTKQPVVAVSEADSLLGVWIVPDSRFETKMTISKDGDSYLIETFSRGLKITKNQYLTSYKKGSFSFGNSLIPDAKYSKNQDKIFWGGKVYIRKQ
ncbi:protein of unknown function [Tenacibaculum sp. 190524A02b]|uniref:hypothetical protein n=1 Tax=Tenacibaculum vairaonense TaxID=3137860 RepID=UPI0032B1A170